MRKFQWRVSLQRAIVLGAVLAAFAPLAASASNSNLLLIGGPRHPLSARPGIRQGQAPVGPSLAYYGGRVVSNMQVVQVLYGAGQYLSNVSDTTTPSLATFYQGVLNSPYVDWLSEYDTNITAIGGGSGTNQAIGRGSFVGQYSITPSPENSGAVIDDTQIQSELAAQILAGHLPSPTSDVGGNNNTYYAVFFPLGVAIKSGGATSCVEFCAYHSTIADISGHEVYYGVHPDMESGSGCEFGCGGGSPFENYTSVASHEMIETITDPEVGLATDFAPPLAWYDIANGEIGDICNANQGTIVGADNVTYTVQKEWSNQANDCIVHGTLPVPAGTISLERPKYSCSSSIGITVADSDLAGSGSVSVGVTTVGGDAETVVLAETPPASGSFVGTIVANSAVLVVGDGVLEVADGDSLTATYNDADNGNGQPATVQSSASIDCTAPMITNVQSSAVGGSHATVAFDTNEPTTSQVRYGLSCATLNSTQTTSSLDTAHQVALTGLSSTTQYFYSVVASDAVGNATTDDNSGSCYSFTTVVTSDYFTELFDADDNDLHNQVLTFTPDGSASFYHVCRSTTTTFPTDPSGGQTLKLDDDDSIQVDLTGAAQVRLYGVAYSSFFVGSNGYLTFGDSDSNYYPTFDGHFNLPRVAPMFDDLDPTAGGRISWKQLSDRVAVTYYNVPEFSTKNSNSFQVELFFDGTIRMTQLHLDALNALVGLSDGSGVSADFAESDLSTYAFCSDFIPGGGVSQTDCVHEWYGAINSVATNRPSGHRVDCTDDDPGCDVGATTGDGACTFQVSLCLNRTDPRLLCTPTDVRSVNLIQPGTKPRDATQAANRSALESAMTDLGGQVQGWCTNAGPSHQHSCSSNAQCDSAPGSGDGQCRRNVVFTPALATPNICSAPIAIRVPLRGPHFTKGVQHLRLAARRSDQAPADRDSLTLICHAQR
ncbi:MAG: fibronectin type III domain-containing protein [Deltaproteobacteria bacterium]|nr:fibronectin type III domain-containing protein [Deltaproteobacteria bacterium]